MNILFAIVCVFGTAATIIFLGTYDIGLGGLWKATIIIPEVIFAVYSMARIPAKKQQTEESTVKKDVS